jgi:hypothetical protein
VHHAIDTGHQGFERNQISQVGNDAFFTVDSWGEWTDIGQAYQGVGPGQSRAQAAAYAAGGTGDQDIFHVVLPAVI